MKSPLAPTVRQRIALAAVFLIACCVFSPSLAIGFRLDDHFQIERNRAVREFDCAAMLTQGYWANVNDPGFAFDPGSDLWRPLTTFSVAVTHAIGGLNPLPYHVENLLLHALCALLVVQLLRTWRRSEIEACLVGALFAVAPVHIEPLGSIILRNELLAAATGLIYLICDAQRKSWWACVALLMALLAKESAIALPVAALFARRFLHGDALRDLLRATLPAAVVCACYLVARFAVLGRIGIAAEAAYFGPEVSTVEVWLTMARFTLQHMLPACLFGSPLVFDYSPQSFPTTQSNDLVAWMMLFGFAALAASAALIAWRSRSYVAFAITLFVILMGPTSNLPTRIGVLGATRLMYLPYLGIACAVVYAGVRSAARFPRASGERLVCFVGALVIAALSLQTWQRLSVWTSDLSFYGDICAVAPRNALANGMLGEAYLARVKLAEERGSDSTADARAAAEAFATSISVDPRNFLRLGRQLSLSSALGRAESELIRGLDAAMRERTADLIELPRAGEEPGEAGRAARASLAIWLEQVAAQRPSDDELARLQVEDRARFLNAEAFVTCLALDQASCLVSLFELRAASAALREASSRTLDAQARTDLDGLCDTVDRSARALVERTGELASPRPGEAAALAAYRRDVKAVFAERYARFALGLAQSAAALRGR